MVSIPSALVIASVAAMATASAFHADSHHRTLQAVNFRQELLNEINAVRKTHKLPELCINNKLMYAAQDHANDMAEHNFVNSTSLNGTVPDVRAFKSGFVDNNVTETVGGGYKTASTIVAAWAETNHAHNTLLSDCNVMGPGYAFDRTKRLVHFWAVDYSTGTCGDGTAKGSSTSSSGSDDDDDEHESEDDENKEKSRDSSGDSDENVPLPAAPPAEDAKTPVGSPPAVDDKTGSTPAIPTKPADLKTPIDPGTVHAASGNPPAPPSAEAPATDPPATEEEARSSESLIKPVTPVAPAKPTGPVAPAKPTVPVGTTSTTPKDPAGAKPTAPGSLPPAAAPLAVDPAAAALIT
uniref:SCP domain-containing protein n=1 Tax=Peronospora matthiolae TaxID=2874970 RepID=A0AAV1TLK9_9STRA